MSALALAVVLAQAAALPQAQPGEQPAQQNEAQRRFETILRSYPIVGAAQSMKDAERLVEAGEFSDRARAEYWIGTARWSNSDKAGARAWMARTRREYPATVWAARAAVTLGDIAGSERDWDAALEQYAVAEKFGSPVAGYAVLAREHAIDARRYWRWFLAAVAFAVAFAAYLASRLSKTRAVPWRPLPTGVKSLGVVTGVVALLAIRQASQIQIASDVIGAGTLALSALTMLFFARARPGVASRAAHALLALVAIACVFYATVYRAGLYEMVMETLRAGPE